MSSVGPTEGSSKAGTDAPRSNRSPPQTGKSTKSGKSTSQSTTTQPTQADDDQDRSMKVLVGKICKSETSAERVDLSKELVHNLTTGMAALFVFGLFLLIAIMEIVVGSMNVDNCPVNRMIPIWLIVSGSVSCLRYVLAIGLAIMDRKDAHLGGLRVCLELIFSLFWITWLILGTYWTYSVNHIVTYEQKNSSAYCDHLTYVLAFILITVTYVIIGMWLICCCCVFCCVAILLPFSST